MQNSFFHKKGEGETRSASYLILMLALFLLVYMILLPSGEKELIIQDMGGVAIGNPTTQVGPYGNNPVPYGGIDDGGFLLSNEGLLFLDSPGLMRPLLQDVTQKPLASVNLFSIEQKRYETLAANIHLSSTLASKDTVEFIFTIDDLEDLSDVQLLFFILDGDGDLTVTLNGVTVLNGAVQTEQLPLTLPSSLLTTVNRLTFSVNKPGIFDFMFPNTYHLRDIVLIETHSVTNNVESRQFVLSDKDVYDLDHLSLLFRPNCFTVNEQGRLVIRLNNNLIHDALIVCDAGLVAIDFSPSDIVPGRNVLDFFIDQGQYTLENVVVEGDYATTNFYKASFDVDPPDMAAIFDGASVVLRASFLNDGYTKEGTIFVNGYPLPFDTHLNEFVANLDGLVYEGRNIISVLPDTTFEFINLEVFLA